jgi:DNA-binding GntR family transcriptional regulator
MRLRHKLRKLMASGTLKVGGRLPAWMHQEETEEASPEDVRKVLEAEPARVSLEALQTSGWVVGKDRVSGRMIVSGESCLSDQYWEIKLKGSKEECTDYLRGTA